MSKHLLFDEVKLVDQTKEIQLFPSLGTFYLMDLDLGYPEVREQEFENPVRHGTNDETAFFGSRPVNISGFLYRTDRIIHNMLDELNTFLMPNKRIQIHVTDKRGIERFLTVRPVQASAPLLTLSTREHLEFNAQFKASDPRMYDAHPTVVRLFPGEAAEGIPFDISFDVQFPPSFGSDSLFVTNTGNMNVDPVIRVFGPCENPKIANETQGKVLSFENLIIDDGDYLDIRPSNRTITLNSEIHQNRYRFLDTSISEWWNISPGENQIRFFPAVSDTPSVCEVHFRSASL